jgi:hypothetical protein
VRWLVVIAFAAACGGSDEHVAPDAAVATDAAIDAMPDPYDGRFDEGREFPRLGCRAGALAGFARENVWIPIGLRTDVTGGALRTFVDDFIGETQAPHTLTPDDLIIRRTTYDAITQTWFLTAMDLCDVESDGTLHGWGVRCFDQACDAPYSINEPPTHRLPNESEEDGLTLLGELALDAAPLNVRVAGDVAYLVVGVGGLRTVSVANPAAPVLLGSYVPATQNFFNDVKLVDAGGRRYAVLAGSPSEVIDVTDPAAPSLVATIPVGAHTLYIEDALAYLVTGYTPHLYIYDLADPRAPVERAAFLVPPLSTGFPVGFHDLFVSGGFAYLSATYYGLVVVDCRIPTAPVVLDTTAEDPAHRYWHSPWLTDVGGRLVIANGDEGPGSGLRLLDGDAASPTFLGRLGEWHLRSEISIHNVMARGARVYLTHYQDGVRVLDITDPTMPAQVGYFNTWQEDHATAAFYSAAIGQDLDAANRRIYVADTIRGLLVLEGTSALFP